MTNKTKTLYTGVTSDLERRIYEHKNRLIEGFTKKYNITKLVYYEVTKDVWSAIEREKQIKGWLRRKKIALIEAVNPEWIDLSEDWFRDINLNFERSAVRCHSEGAKRPKNLFYEGEKQDSSPSAENDRMAAENDRMAAENDRMAAENDRMAAENDKMAAQNDKMAAQEARR